MGTQTSTGTENNNYPKFKGGYDVGTAPSIQTGTGKTIVEASCIIPFEKPKVKHPILIELSALRHKREVNCVVTDFREN